MVQGMKCTYCGSEELRTLETRDSTNNMNRRRKECLSCGKRMTTYEYIEEIELMVKKKDGRLERFNIDKIITGLQKACEKRPVTLDQIKDIAEKVRQDILAEGRDEVSTKEIGDKIIAYLKELDYIAYVTFASVYRDFKEPEDFQRLMNEEK